MDSISLIELLPALTEVLAKQVVEREGGNGCSLDRNEVIMKAVRQLWQRCTIAMFEFRQDRYPRMKQDEMLDHYGIRGRWRPLGEICKEVPPADQERVLKAFYRNLAFCLQRVGMPLEYVVRTDGKCSPWSDWRSGDKFLVVLGSRFQPVVRMGREFQCRVVSDRDAEVLCKLSNGLRDHLHIEARLEVLKLEHDMEREEVEQKYMELKRQRDLGIILAVGSPRVDPLADVMAHHIFTSLGRQTSPVRFAWTEPPSRGESFLSLGDSVGRDQEGIRYDDGKRRFFVPRLNDGDAINQKIAGAEGPWSDCGFVLLDVTERPWQAILCGHGGCGTLGCVDGLLSCQEALAAQLHEEAGDNAILGPGRALMIIRIDRIKPTAEWLDDFTYVPVGGCYEVFPGGMV